MKRKLSNLKTRNDFPSSLTVTEFDPVEMDGRQINAAAFHTVFADTLTGAQQSILREWWLDLMDLSDNQGRAFQYDDKDGGLKLQNYIAKDVDFKASPPRMVKSPPAWIPHRTDCRLWFTVGTGRHRRAKDGSRLRAQEGRVRKRFECVQGIKSLSTLSVSTGNSECEHGIALITTDSSELPANCVGAVSKLSRESVNEGDLAAVTELRRLSPANLNGGSVQEVYGLGRALPYRLLSLRLDMGGLEIARLMHTAGELCLVCASSAGSIFHMLLADCSGLPPYLHNRLRNGTAIPRNLEVIYLSS